MNIQHHVCPKHSKHTIQFICAAQNCTQHRGICDACKQKQALHFSYHGNYIFRLKQFFEFNNSKSVIPRLQKGIQDIETIINKHKQYYREEIIKIKRDFEQIVEGFIEATQKYKKVYLQNFEKEINMFDSEIMDIINNVKSYANEKSHQESFFTKLFANTSGDQSSLQSIQGIVNKNIKGFEVRASIINLKSRLANSKTSITSYKKSETQQKMFLALMDSLNMFCEEFYNRFGELVVTENPNSVQQKSSLKSSIASETKSLKLSRVGSMEEVSNASFSSNGQGSMMKVASLVRVSKMPEPHPKVIDIKKYLKPLPNFSNQNNSVVKQGPYRYETGTYLGGYQNGLRSGRGVFVFDDGSQYEGNWDQDNMSGYGRLIKFSSYYEGDIVNGFAHGKGSYQDFDKTYSGEWRNDQRHGLGEQEFKNKVKKYVGSFVKDVYEGRGKLFEAEYSYEGDFKKGLFNGEGLIRYKNGQIFKGSFLDGCKAFGRHTFLDGSYYEGVFKENMPHGNGQFYWPDGIKYSGLWKQGMQDGLGIETLANGKQLKGIWQNGVWTKWIS